MGFGMIFWIFSGGSGWSKSIVFDVFWCSWGPWTILEWFWMDSGSFIFSSFFDIFCHLFLPLLHKIFSFNLTNIILRLGISSLLYFRMPFLILTKVNGKLLRNLKFGSGLNPFPEIEEISNSVHVRNYSLSRSALRVTLICGLEVFWNHLRNAAFVHWARTL